MRSSCTQHEGAAQRRVQASWSYRGMELTPSVDLQHDVQPHVVVFTSSIEAVADA